MEKELEIINKLFLELSQFTTARTEREIYLENERIRLVKKIEEISPQTKC